MLHNPENILDGTMITLGKAPSNWLIANHMNPTNTERSFYV